MSMGFALLLALCSPKVSFFFVSVPQHFGVIDLRYHFAIHNSAGGGLLDGLHRAAAV
jgi:hypothetical protein